MRFLPKYIGFSIFIGIGLLIGLISQFPDSNLHVVFCDVGQGDAIYIRTPSHQDMLIDGGPSGKAMLECLSKYMPFYDRTIDVIVATHPQHDHYGGLKNVLERYSASYFVIPPVDNSSSKSFGKLKELIREQNIPVVNSYTGDTIRMGSVSFETLWPEKKWIDTITNNPEITDNSSVLGAFTTKQDLNDFSIYFHVQMGEFDMLLTGDGDIRIQDDLMRAVSLPDVEVFKVPHHGSKTGMSEEFLRTIQPELAIIQVGKKNSYGHPAEIILKMLSDAQIRILRTDQAGDIQVVSDGKSWWVEK